MGDKDWITVEQEIIEEHNYSLTIQTLSGIDELISVVMDKYSRKEPILFFMWQPHVLTSVLDVMRVHYLDEGKSSSTVSFTLIRIDQVRRQSLPARDLG